MTRKPPPRLRLTSEGVGIEVLQSSREQLDGYNGAPYRAAAQARRVHSPKVRDAQLREEVRSRHDFYGEAGVAGAVGKVLRYGTHLREGEG